MGWPASPSGFCSGPAAATSSSPAPTPLDVTAVSVDNERVAARVRFQQRRCPRRRPMSLLLYSKTEHAGGRDYGPSVSGSISARCVC